MLFLIIRSISGFSSACADTDTEYCREQQSYREQYLPYAFDRMHGLSMRESRNFLHFLSFLLKFLCTMITLRAAFATGHAQTHVVLSRRAGLRFGACALPQISRRSFSRRGHPHALQCFAECQRFCPLGLCCFSVSINHQLSWLETDTVYLLSIFLYILSPRWRFVNTFAQLFLEKFIEFFVLGWRWIGGRWMLPMRAVRS